MRALGRRLREPLDADERGKLLETLILHELRAQIAYSDIGGELSYWRTPSCTEVDFVWSRPGRATGIEVKSSSRLHEADGRALKELLAAGTIARARSPSPVSISAGFQPRSVASLAIECAACAADASSNAPTARIR